jgi:hypothetical protein
MQSAVALVHDAVPEGWWGKCRRERVCAWWARVGPEVHEGRGGRRRAAAAGSRPRAASRPRPLGAAIASARPATRGRSGSPSSTCGGLAFTLRLEGSLMRLYAGAWRADRSRDTTAGWSTMRRKCRACSPQAGSAIPSRPPSVGGRGPPKGPPPLLYALWSRGPPVPPPHSASGVRLDVSRNTPMSGCASSDSRQPPIQVGSMTPWITRWPARSQA